MTSTPPSETAPETADPLTALVLKWRRQAIEERPRDDEADASLWWSALDGAADDLMAVIEAFGETVESTEYRVTGTALNGSEHVVTGGDQPDDARRQATRWRRWSWTNVRIESRTVRTWTSGWSPVPDDTQEK